MEVELHVTGIAHGGLGVARQDGRVVFVADALPGERVRALLTQERPRFARAVAIEVLEASPDRVEHIWPEAGIARDPAERVGGAELGHATLARQRALKSEVLTDALLRFGGVPFSGVATTIQASEAPHGPQGSRAPENGAQHLNWAGAVEGVRGDDERGGLGWRTRVRLQADAAGRLGQRAARSHRVVPVTTLPLAVPAIHDVLGMRFDPGTEVEVLAPGGELRLVIGRQAPTVIEERVGDRTFRLDDTGFWQVHRDAPEVLVRAVRDALVPELFAPDAGNLDLYGGVGLLATALADVGGSDTRIETVESDARASGHAAENLADLQNAIATTARVDHWLRDASPRPGATIVLDPPRSGAGIETTEAIARLGAAQIIYVACDPVALARDTRVLQRSGYLLTRLEAFDLFPHTHHLEAVGTFVAASAAG